MGDISNNIRLQTYMEEIWRALCTGYIYSIYCKEGIPRDHTIYSIRIIKTGEIYSLDDKVVWNWNSPPKDGYEVIRQWKVEEGQLKFQVARDDYWYKFHELTHQMWNLQHYKEPEVMYTTEDGVVIKDITTHVYGIDDTFNCYYNPSAGTVISEEPEYKFFSTPEARDKYIMFNKPCICLDDLYRMSSNNYITIDKEAAVQSFVKQKLNNK